jgi:GntR family transcriptional regulator, rspAB operon transcriptional repressor
MSDSTSDLYIRAGAVQKSQRPELISEHTYQSIRNSIIACQLRPGAPFVEADVARRLGISRSPLREAVRRLEQEGFLETANGKRRIASLTPAQVLQLYEFRCVLEKFAADRSEGLISPRDLEGVTSKLDFIYSELERGNVQPFNEADFEFHQLFISKCGNPMIVKQLSVLQSQLLRVRHFFGSRVEHTFLAYEEHLAIIGAIRAPKTGGLAKAVESHIQAVGRRVAEFVREKQSEDKLQS